MSNQKFTALPEMFDASTVAPSQPMEAIPNGFYNVAITDGEVKPTEGGTGIRLEMEFTILDGPYKGRKIFDGFNTKHSSAKAQEISQQNVSAICHATGTIRFQDVQEFFNKPFQLQVGIEPGRWVDGNNQEVAIPPGQPVGTPPPGAVKYYEAKNRFKGAKAGQGAAAPATGGAAPAWAKPPTAGTAPAPATGVAPATPPWATPGGAAKAPAAAAPAPVAAPAAAPAGPKAPKGPKAAKPAPERTFFVFMPDGTVKQPAIPESEVLKMLANGMPAETQVNPGLEDDGWKTAAEYGIGAAPAAAPAAATPAGAPVAPPWARTA